MTDLDIIKEAYQDEMKKLFTAFWSGWQVAANQKEKDADISRFVTAITRLRQARDAAIGALP